MKGECKAESLLSGFAEPHLSLGEAKWNESRTQCQACLSIAEANF